MEVFLTLTYESTKAIPNYNVMGVCKSALEASVKYLARDLGAKGMRVNAISAGPIKTLAASAIGDAKFLYKWNEDHSFLKRNVDIHDVGNSALYLLSNLANGVTGEIHYVDAGYNKVGMPDPKNISEKINYVLFYRIINYVLFFNGKTLFTVYSINDMIKRIINFKTVFFFSWSYK